MKLLHNDQRHKGISNDGYAIQALDEYAFSRFPRFAVALSAFADHLGANPSLPLIFFYPLHQHTSDRYSP